MSTHIVNHDKPNEVAVPTTPIPQVTEIAEVGVISFKINRQTLIVSALAILLAISVVETIELTRLHQALKIWQTLPSSATTASAVTGPVPSSPSNGLPAQVGGC